jgi:hypothetical protein
MLAKVTEIEFVDVNFGLATRNIANHVGYKKMLIF